MMESDVNPSNGVAVGDGEEAEYTLQYQRIVSGEQRSRYKEDFNSQYNEYRNLHKAIDKVSKRFAQLEEELRQQNEGTTAWQVPTIVYSFIHSFVILYVRTSTVFFLLLLSGFCVCAAY